MSKKGSTLAEVIICFTLLVLLITMMNGAIQFSHKMIVKADEIRATAAEIAIQLIEHSYSNNPPATAQTANVTLTDGSLTLQLDLTLQSKEITAAGGAVYHFLVYAVP
ncbi:MAG: hypothetical protein LLG09_02540 [Negativicutes bacterium]|nr:hypothetical protein [Negativicutes bacterium]